MEKEKGMILSEPVSGIILRRIGIAVLSIGASATFLFFIFDLTYPYQIKAILFILILMIGFIFILVGHIIRRQFVLGDENSRGSIHQDESVETKYR